MQNYKKIKSATFIANFCTNYIYKATMVSIFASHYLTLQNGNMHLMRFSHSSTT